jgi:hypothetical protein
MSEPEPYEPIMDDVNGFYYDMDGQPISLREWAQLCSAPEKMLGDFMIGPARVTTVYLGLNDDPLDPGPPRIFGTLLRMDGAARHEVMSVTKEEALKIHASFVSLMTQAYGKD